MQTAGMELSGKHAVVTGGSSGIGLETARLLVERGARVSLVARDRGRLDAAKRETPARPQTASIDVTDPDAVDAGFARLTAGEGPCDLLVTSAGEAQPGYFEQLDLSVFRAQMDLDYFGTLHCVRAVVPSMLERGEGTIVGVSSAAGPHRRVRLHGLRAGEVRGARPDGHACGPSSDPTGSTSSCAYPPDTDTPGFARENETKPPETVAVSASIKVMPPGEGRGEDRARHREGPRRHHRRRRRLRCCSRGRVARAGRSDGSWPRRCATSSREIRRLPTRRAPPTPAPGGTRMAIYDAKIHDLDGADADLHDYEGKAAARS